MLKKESIGVSRRNFIKGASAAAAVTALGSSGLDCIVDKKIEKVTLGRTGMKASKFLGDRMPDRVMYELAIASGVNYWHKFGHWIEPAPYDLFRKLDRDSFYCDTTVPSLDKDEAIRIFEKVLKDTGLEYIDGFKIHSQYRNAEDVKTKKGAVEAFEYLKKKGKTRFLMMSQHINTSEVFEAAVESDMFDLIQVPVNPVVPRDYLTNEVFPQKAKDVYFSTIKKAAEKGTAVTAMKVFMFGPKYWDEIPDLKEKVKNYLPDNKSIATALIHWTLDVPGVLAFGNMVSSFEELKENLEAAGGKLDENEAGGLKKFSECIGGYYCRMCGACEKANPCGVAVSDILRFYGYYKGYDNPQSAKALYNCLPKHRRADSLKDFGAYEKNCPYKLPLTKLLREAHNVLA